MSFNDVRNIHAKAVAMRTYEINLLDDVEGRWLPVIKHEKQHIKRLIQDSAEKMVFPRQLKPVVKKLYEAIGGKYEYARDIRTLAGLLNLDTSDVICANLEYELTTCLLKNPFACTSAAFYRPNQGMLHIRNLDWPGEYVGPYTIKVHYLSHQGEFTAVTWPGFVGIMSAVAKGRFSATINWLPWSNSGLLPAWFPKPNLLGWPASFLLRYIFERCKTYEEALREIKRKKVVVPVLITLVGPKKEQAVAIERGTKNYRIRNYREPALVATNHYSADEKKRSKVKLREDESNNYTYKRKFMIEKKARQIRISRLSDAFKLLRCRPVFNDCTTQSMVFSVTTGKALVRTF